MFQLCKVGVTSRIQFCSTLDFRQEELHFGRASREDAWEARCCHEQLRFLARIPGFLNSALIYHLVRLDQRRRRMKKLQKWWRGDALPFLQQLLPTKTSMDSFLMWKGAPHINTQHATITNKMAAKPWKKETNRYKSFPMSPTPPTPRACTDSAMRPDAFHSWIQGWPSTCQQMWSLFFTKVGMQPQM